MLEVDNSALFQRNKAGGLRANYMYWETRGWMSPRAKMLRY